MRDVKPVYMNDIIVSIPYSDFKTRMNIISELENKKRHGERIKRIEVDDLRKCVVYQMSNTQFN